MKQFERGFEEKGGLGTSIPLDRICQGGTFSFRHGKLVKNHYGFMTYAIIGFTWFMFFLDQNHL